MTIVEIRETLKHIRYYYSRKDIFDKETSTVGENAICKTVDKFNQIVCAAPPRLFDLYISLYKENNTQESLADKLGYSIEHISRLNKQLVKFIFKQLNGKEA